MASKWGTTLPLKSRGLESATFGWIGEWVQNKGCLEEFPQWNRHQIFKKAKPEWKRSVPDRPHHVNKKFYLEVLSAVEDVSHFAKQVVRLREQHLERVVHRPMPHNWNQLTPRAANPAVLAVTRTASLKHGPEQLKPPENQAKSPTRMMQDTHSPWTFLIRHEKFGQLDSAWKHLYKQQAEKPGA